ncbi:redoxin domain-containing protein [Chitinophaga sp. Cy-1792]|uniref:TlpA family protein disulfide reductase n=1 Tax=Chitinophaga sp. Cy-1792 TaxID=2608339 RepID=UPI0014207A49|nr:redoxin domain-containing protein [Chitinophaga sp. Cy-1792]
MVLWSSGQAWSQEAHIITRVAGARTGHKITVAYWSNPGISAVTSVDTVLAKDSVPLFLPVTARELFFYIDAGSGNIFYGMTSAGEKLEINFKEDTILFSGPNAATCRLIYLLKQQERRTRMGLQATATWLPQQIKAWQQLLKNDDQLLLQYKDSLSPNTYSIVKADAQGGIASKILSIYQDADPDQQEAIYVHTVSPALPALEINELTTKSVRLLDYLVDKAQSDYHRAMHMPCTDEAVYNWLKMHYNGIVQEKLLAHQLLMAFANGGQQEEMEKCARDYLSFVQSDVCKLAVQVPYNRLKRGIRRGLPAPDFSLPDFSGHTVSLNQFEGKVVLLHFCSDDDELMPTLDEISKCFDKAQVAFLHIGMKPYTIKGNGTQLYPGDQFSLMEQRYNVSSCPTLIVINRHGYIFAVKPPDPAMDYGNALTNIIYEALQQ